jgi:hypothetical protein
VECLKVGTYIGDVQDDQRDAEHVYEVRTDGTDYRVNRLARSRRVEFDHQYDYDKAVDDHTHHARRRPVNGKADVALVPPEEELVATENQAR